MNIIVASTAGSLMLAAVVLTGCPNNNSSSIDPALIGTFYKCELYS